MRLKVLPDNSQGTEVTRLGLSIEAESYVSAGSPEFQVFNAVPEDGVQLSKLKVSKVAAEP